jgi:RIO-like serine/threonine protein kinase
LQDSEDAVHIAVRNALFFEVNNVILKLTRTGATSVKRGQRRQAYCQKVEIYE